jgi:hypothetical protein
LVPGFEERTQIGSVIEVVRKMSAPQTDEAKLEGRKLHNDELHNLCSSLDINRMIKPGRIK